MGENIHILLSKLDEFIRKYYRNRLLKGLILFSAILLFSFLVVNAMEFFGRFGPLFRTLLFYLYILANTLVFTFYILIPVFKIRRIGKILSYDQAARVIGDHFPEIRDKLLNTLQLQRESERKKMPDDLLLASIDQRIKRLKPIPFIAAIDLKKNRKYLKYALPPLLLLLLTLIIAPSFVTRPSVRILYHNHEFTIEAPFRFELVNGTLTAFQQEDFRVVVKVSGEKLPQEVFISANGSTYKMTEENRIRFSYLFRTLQKDIKFRFVAGEYESPEYLLKVFPKPTILSFDAELKYPAYTNRKDEMPENTGDLLVPEGTKIRWTFYTKDVNKLVCREESMDLPVEKPGGNVFSFSSVIVKSKELTVYTENAYTVGRDTIALRVTMIPDAFPVITVEEASDTILRSRIFFQGVIKDDYGFSKLEFHYDILPGGDTSQRRSKSVAVPFSRSVNQQTFYHTLEPGSIIGLPGDVLEYYFEVSDNDGVHGPKSARTTRFTFKNPSIEEIEELTDQQEEKITNTLESSIKEAKRLQKEIDELNRKMVEKSSLNWQDRKQVEELIERHREIKDNLDLIRKQNELKNNYEEQYKEIDPSILEKQNQLNELFNQVMDEEMKKMVMKLQEMLDKMDKDQISKTLEKMKFDSKDLENQLDRTLELFRQLEFEKDLSETIDKLKELAENQEKLADKTNAKKEEEEKLLEEQKALSDEFDKMKEKISDLERKNRELEDPNTFPDTKKEQEEIGKEMKSGEQELENKNRKNAGNAQKKASKGMQDLAQKLENMKNSMEQEQAEEDMEQLRQILENMVRISFDQEDLMKQTSVISRNDPRYLKLIQDQNNLKEDLKTAEDSLQKLAKRQAMIKPYIMRELSNINQNIGDAVSNLNDRNIPGATARQQYIMTSVNNLALLLSDILKQMESNMNSMMQAQGKNSCSSKGAKGKPSVKTMRELQEGLNKKLEELKKQMESQMKKGQGQKTRMGDQKISEQLARYAAEQEAIRNEMKKYLDQLNSEGVKNTGELNSVMEQMEQTEKELINKKILQETLNRQQQILTRLLDSEKAEQKREQEEKRQSTETKVQKYSNPDENFEYNGIKKGSSELMRTIQPSYNYFFRNKINSYFLKFER